MGLMDRVSTLIRANLNDLIDKAEHPEKMIKQLIIDMENQLIQVKTQVAVAIADQHMLEQKEKENAGLAEEWMRKAERAVDKNQDDLARAALERHRSYLQLAANFKEQVADQAAQVEELKAALRKLEQKLSEAHAKSQLLLAQHRRARAVGKARDAQMSMGSESKIAGFERMKQRIAHESAVSQAKGEMIEESLDDKFAALEKEDEIEKLLSDMKARRHASA
ncbi:MAG TPA: PspA/IM30 family protein [Candidatus Acidoferrales bacterium]|nr:PspA/IM30 family protein [Candidatus Acidoferrales bacterium]